MNHTPHNHWRQDHQPSIMDFIQQQTMQVLQLSTQKMSQFLFLSPRQQALFILYVDNDIQIDQFHIYKYGKNNVKIIDNFNHQRVCYDGLR